MLDLSANMLRVLTEGAEREKNGVSEKAAENRRKERVSRILSTLATSFAMSGDGKAVVMVLQDDEYKIPPTWEKKICRPAWLQGAALNIFNQLLSLDVNPAIEYWCDEAAGKQGYQIVISW